MELRTGLVRKVGRCVRDKIWEFSDLETDTAAPKCVRGPALYLMAIHCQRSERVSE